jgi:REP-associated tyrosine transposase
MQFEANGIYHVYNRGNQKTKVFFEPRNYLYFLEKVRKYILPFADVLAYCLMPNHFHFMIRVKDDTIGGKLNKNIGILLRSYTRAVNIQEGDSGSLFQSHTKAKRMDEKAELPLICFNYIHLNPLKAKLVKDLVEWSYSSFLDFTGARNGTLVNMNALGDVLDIDIVNYEKEIFEYLIDGNMEKELF